MNDEVLRAAEALREGKLVAFPTETVYGLGGDASNTTAIKRIFAVKGRPADHPLIVHLASRDYLDAWADKVPNYVRDLIEAFWPGPLTVVVRKLDAVSSLVTGGQDSVGLRVPNHALAQELLLQFSALGGVGIAAPSANRFGRVSPTAASAVREELGRFLDEDDLILDGGPCAIGLESTILDCTGDRPAIARPGAITADMIREVVGQNLVPFLGRIRTSGMLPSHYAPRAKVVLDEEPKPGDGLIALAIFSTPPGVVRLVEARDPLEYAQKLYEGMREADALGLRRVVAILPEGSGISLAIKDRLERASSKS